MTLLAKTQSPWKKCPHGNVSFCPHGCFQTEFELAIIEVMKNSSSETEGSIQRILLYKQAEARQLGSDLSEVLREIAKLEDRLSDIRSRKEN